jgi:hypothetical protein
VFYVICAADLSFMVSGLASAGQLTAADFTFV